MIREAFWGGNTEKNAMMSLTEKQLLTVSAMLPRNLWYRDQK